ncbi:MAG: hypothetical protein E7082_06040 [Bacteroidales bacterium]|nr:hypothetical protein [Bacteroidales bacterium]
MTTKKLLSLALLMPLLGFLTACDDDSNDLPDVDIKVVMTGATQDPTDNTLHITQGTPLVIESITAEPRNGKEAVLGLTTYYLNGMPTFQTVLPPFTATLNTSSLIPGSYKLQIRTSVYQVDKSAAVCLLTFNLIVDEPVSDEPGEPSTLTIVHSGEEALFEK